jgi:hypothetical protein
MFQNNDNFTSRRCLITGDMSVLLRLVLLFVLASVLQMASGQQQVPSCCESESEKLSQSQVKALGQKDRADSRSMLRGYAAHQRNRRLGDFCGRSGKCYLRSDGFGSPAYHWSCD